jgi:hypothetical protein
LETAGRLTIFSAEHLQNVHWWVSPEDNKICNGGNNLSLNKHKDIYINDVLADRC